jgi:hypothetical protein
MVAGFSQVAFGESNDLWIANTLAAYETFRSFEFPLGELIDSLWATTGYSPVVAPEKT